MILYEKQENFTMSKKEITTLANFCVQVYTQY